jgi:hypothetical protein
MRTIALALALILSFPVSETGSVAVSKDFSLPPPKAWDTSRTLKCKALATLVVHQKGLADADKKTLVAEIKPGSDLIELTLVKDTLLVRVGEHGTDRYKVTGNTQLFLSAVFIGPMLPLAHTIVIAKDKGYVTWTINEPMDLFTDIPYSQTIYFACQ